MFDSLFPFVGGIGLFLVGMMLLSDGLVAFAGGTLQRALARFTSTPWKAFVSGTAVTALLQSSTATTVTLIGFVSAGLISFTQAIGVVIGASLGNTATGWIVAGLGLKINLGFYTLPLIGAGAMLRLMARGRWRSLGVALAGFGILFLGLDTLQKGMQGMSGLFNFADLPVGGYGAYLAIMLIGLALTAVLQSSTAAIAMTLTALHTNAISFDQASTMVIGASVGTTLTSALVAIGGTIYAKRTALAYILFNLAAGLIAIVLLPALLAMIDFATRHGLSAGALALAAFHSLFIAVGVAVFLPFTGRYARFVERLMPERSERPAPHLDDTLLGVPPLALAASQRTLEQAAGDLIAVYGHTLGIQRQEAGQLPDLSRVRQTLEQAFDFLTRIAIPTETGDALGAQRIAQLHAADHLLRLRGRLGDLIAANADFNRPEYQWAMTQSRDIYTLARAALDGRAETDGMQRMEQDALTLTSLAQKVRHDYLQGARPDALASQALHATDAFRWLERTGNHIWRACHYLGAGRPAENRPAADSSIVHD